jgi:hypothetical protein
MVRMPSEPAYYISDGSVCLYVPWDNLVEWHRLGLVNQMALNDFPMGLEIAVDPREFSMYGLKLDAIRMSLDVMRIHKEFPEAFDGIWIAKRQVDSLFKKLSWAPGKSVEEVLRGLPR